MAGHHVHIVPLNSSVLALNYLQQHYLLQTYIAKGDLIAGNCSLLRRHGGYGYALRNNVRPRSVRRRVQICGRYSIFTFPKESIIKFNLREVSSYDNLLSNPF